VWLFASHVQHRKFGHNPAYFLRLAIPSTFLGLDAKCIEQAIGQQEALFDEFDSKDTNRIYEVDCGRDSDVEMDDCNADRYW
jgi:hypothetical protein